MIHTSLRFAFFGTDDFSLTVLEELKKTGLVPVLIVTPPDRPKGRGLALTPPPAKLWALKNNIECFQPVVLDSSVTGQLSKVNGQLFIVASYGLIIPKEILEIPKHGTLNVHPSLLPKYRGATPIENQILNDEKEVGVTIMLMDEETDHGPIVAQRQWENTKQRAQNPNKTQSTDIKKASELRQMLAEEGGKLLGEVMPQWVTGKIKAIAQDDSKATYTKKLIKADGEVHLSQDPYKNFLKILAFQGSIGTYFFVFSSSPFQGEVPTCPESLRGSPRGRGVKKIRVIIKEANFQNGKLILTRVVPEGKKEMSYEEFLRGLH